MKPAFFKDRIELLLLPFVFLFVWFRFEPYFHERPVLLALWIVLFYLTSLVLYKAVLKYGKVIVIGLWLVISSLIVIDFVQHFIYANYSDSRFQSQVDASTAVIRGRVQAQIQEGKQNLDALQALLESNASLSVDALFVRLDHKFGNSKFLWAVYDQSGQLSAWKGQFENKEPVLPAGTEETTVISDLHNQFLRVKRAVSLHGKLFQLIVLRQIGADYGIRNQYLHTYNLLTDGLAVHPVLLYNSQTTATASDLVVRNISITGDFSISAVYQKSQYFDSLRKNEGILHWWLELFAFVFCLYAVLYLFFEFTALLKTDGMAENRRTTRIWIVFLLACLLSVYSVGRFTTFGLASAGSGYEAVQGSSPAHLFSRALFTMIGMVSFAVYFSRRKWGLSWNGFTMHALVLFPAFFGMAFMIRSYFHFIRNCYSETGFDLTDYSFQDFSFSKTATQVGVLWFDLAFSLFAGIVFSFLLRRMPRRLSHFAGVLAVELCAMSGFLLSVSSFTPSSILHLFLCSSAILTFAFYISPIWTYFQNVNLLSRFLVLLGIVFSCAIPFYLVRLYYSEELQRNFVVTQVAPRVMNQEDWIRHLLVRSEAQLDSEIRSLSIDPSIPDLAYRLWSRTDLAAYGCKSSVEIYDENGVLLNRFSLNLPSLRLNVAQIAGNDQWRNQQGAASFGNVRKMTQFGARVLPDVGYVVAQVVQDYENLPFVASASPFQELFRVSGDKFPNGESIALTIYDPSWHPDFVSDPEYSPSTELGRELLRNGTATWGREWLGGRKCQIYFFRLPHGYAAITIRGMWLGSHVVHLIDLLLFNMMWLVFAVLPPIFLFRKSIFVHHPESSVRFSFFQKLLFAFVIFTMIPMVSLSILIRNYVWEQEIKEVTNRSLTSFSVASVVVADYLLLNQQNSKERTEFSDGILEWIGQAIQQDVSFYYEKNLAATSKREFFRAGFLGQRIPGHAYVDLFLRGQKYSISEAQIGSLKFLNVSGRLQSATGFEGEVISIPFMIDQNRVEAKIMELREYTMLVGAGLILFAIFLGYFLASRISRPVKVLIQGTGEMARGNLDFRISEEYQDEFKQLVLSFNTMAGSLQDQQEALERRRAYIENIVNNITTAVVSIDSTMAVTKVNPAAARKFGVSWDFQGSLDDLLMSGSKLPTAAAAFRGFLIERERFQMKEISGEESEPDSTLRLIYVPLFEEHRWNGAVFLSEDITDIIRSNRLSAWAEMARRVAHEVKNPLTPIQLAIEHVVRVYEDRSPDFERVLLSCRDAVLKQVKTLRRLVSEFSQYGRPSTLHREEVNLNTFLKDLTASYGSHLSGNITMKTNFEPDLPVLKIDEEKIKGSLMNILENGLQALNGKGTITIQATNGAAEPYVSIRITDTGEGIPAEIVPRLFEPYFSTKSGGTGLGLAIARKNIEDHGGKIQVESRPHQGTTVTVLLPK